MKKTLCICLSLLLCLSLWGCGGTETKPASEAAPSQSGSATPVAETSTIEGVIDLAGSSIGTTVESVRISGTTATITAGGEYTVRGKLENGQIVVNASEEDARVILILDGAEITNESDACIFVQQCDKLKLVLSEGSSNSLTSGTPTTELVSDENANGAVIFSEDDLDVEGSGQLSIHGYINNGITCKDDLAVQGGELTVIAVNNGLRGSESVEIEAGKLSINAGGDGIKSTSAKKENKGYVSVSGGELSINAVGDGIEAETQLLISGGKLDITTTGEPERGSAKGLKAETGVLISGGELLLNTTDHCIRSFGDFELSGGSLSLSSSMGRGISAKGSLSISGVELTVDSIEDGLYSETDLRIDSGKISIASGEDGIHAGQNGSGEGTVTVNGGDILVSAYQDGIDAKVSLNIHGGNLLACGKSKVDKPASAQSSQSSILCHIDGHAGSELLVHDEGDVVIGSLSAVYPFTSVLFSRSGIGTCRFTCEGENVSAVAK